MLNIDSDEYDDYGNPIGGTELTYTEIRDILQKSTAPQALANSD